MTLRMGLLSSGFLGLAAVTAWADCTPYFSAQPFGEVSAGLYLVDALVIEQDGAQVLFGITGSNDIVRWDGQTLSVQPLPEQQSSTFAVVFDRVERSSGPEYWIGTSTGAYQFDPTTETATRVMSRAAFGFAYFDDGTGEQLYYTSNQGIYRGTSSSDYFIRYLGGGCGGYALLVWDDGTGPALYMSGAFRRVRLGDSASDPTITTSGVARYSSAGLSALGIGLSSVETFCNVPAYVNCMTIWDDGNGPALYVGGEFDFAGTEIAPNIARWDGIGWTALGDTSVELTEPGSIAVGGLEVVNYDRGPQLFAIGQAREIGDITVNGVGVWDGQSWESFAGGVTLTPYDSVYTIQRYDDADGPAVYLSGVFSNVGPVAASRLVRFGCRCPDLNGDAIIDLSDLAVVLADFGGTASASDPDNDGDMDLHDLAVLLAYFGSPCS